MLERLEKRAAAIGRRRAEARRLALVERLAEAAPAGVEIAQDGEQVVLRGRGLVRRFMLDPALRWLTMEGRDG